MAIWRDTRWRAGWLAGAVVLTLAGCVADSEPVTAAAGPVIPELRQPPIQPDQAYQKQLQKDVAAIWAGMVAAHQDE